MRIGSAYEIVRYRSDHKAQVIELQTHLWSPDRSLNASYFEWKYEQNPYLKEPLLYLALAHGKVVGMRGFFGVRWECGVPPQRFTALYADDMVIAPEHRNRGLMSKIMNAAFEDLADRDFGYVFNLSAGLVTLTSSVSMGWRSAGWARPMHRRLWSRALKNRIRPYAKKLPLFSGILGHVAPHKPVTAQDTLEAVDTRPISYAPLQDSSISVEDSPRCDAMADLVSRIGSDGRIRHVRDGEYFRWRFQNPLARYRFIYCGRDGLDGYLVLQDYTSEYTNRELLNIVDWEARDDLIQKRLLEVAVSLFFKGRDITVWTATLPQSVIALLHKCGFRSASRPANLAHFPPEIIMRPTVPSKLNDEWIFERRALLNLKNWDLRMLYSMHG